MENIPLWLSFFLYLFLSFCLYLSLQQHKYTIYTQWLDHLVHAWWWWWDLHQRLVIYLSVGLIYSFIFLLALGTENWDRSPNGGSRTPCQVLQQNDEGIMSRRFIWLLALTSYNQIIGFWKRGDRLSETARKYVKV
jgi:hypothetical protein